MRAPATRLRLVLASASPRRLELLAQAGIAPDALMPADVDETPARSEHPRSLARRLCREKVESAREALVEHSTLDDTLILGADTVVAVGRQIVPKADLREDAVANLRILSGRMHRVFTGLCLLGPDADRPRIRVVESRVRFKRLAREEIEFYVASGEWRGKAGGYAIQGLAGRFVVRLVGSYTNVVGLPLYEAVSLLGGAGYDVLGRSPAPEPAAS